MPRSADEGSGIVVESEMVKLSIVIVSSDDEFDCLKANAEKSSPVGPTVSVVTVSPLLILRDESPASIL